MLKLFLLSCCIGIVTAQAEGRSPFCDKCVCTGETLNRPDVDCSNKSMSGEMYDPKYYSNGTVYPLRTVKLSHQYLRDIDKVFPTSNMTTLDLSNNYIRTIAEAAFGNLTYLEELILSFNNLDSLESKMFKGNHHIDGLDYPMKYLRVLRLDNNKIHSISSDVFQHIDREVEVLILSHNPLKVLDLSTSIAITSIISLKELDLSYTEINSLPDTFLHTPKYLRILNLSGNRFEDIPKQLEESTNIEVLYMNANLFKNISEKNGFPKMPSLKILHLSDNTKLEELGKHSLSNAGNLLELYVENNILQKIDPDAMTLIDFENKDWPPLKKLSLYNNKLSYIELSLLAHWDRLTYLDIRSNPWTCESENQWMLDELMPIYIKINESMAMEMICEAPIEMLGKSMYNLSQIHYTMRGLDLYGNRPERDGAILVGLLVGLLLGIPLVLLVVYAYQRHWFGFFDRSPAGFSRQFYSTADTDEKF